MSPDFRAYFGCALAYGALIALTLRLRRRRKEAAKDPANLSCAGETTCAACDAVDEAYGPILRHDDNGLIERLFPAGAECPRHGRDCRPFARDARECAYLRVHEIFP
jgi:hypothetical protein